MATSEKYLPAQPPREASPGVRQFLDEELARIASILNSEIICLEPQSEAPEKPSNGVVTYANGVDWDPGSGEGFYGYEAGSWVKL